MDCPLTFKEMECIRLAGAGMTQGEIAYETGVAESTVRTRMSNCYMKLGVPNSAQAWMVCVREGWVEMQPGVEPEPGEPGRCEICGNQFPTETGRCRVCEDEIQEQLSVMDTRGDMKPDTVPDGVGNWNRVASDYLPLLRPELLHFRWVIVEIATEAAKLPRDITRADLADPLRQIARMQGAPSVRQGLIKLAAVACRWAVSLPEPKEQEIEETEIDVERIAKAMLERERVA